MAKGNMKGKNMGDSNRGSVPQPDQITLPNHRAGSLLSGSRDRNSELAQSRKRMRTRHGSYVTNK